MQESKQAAPSSSARSVAARRIFAPKHHFQLAERLGQVEAIGIASFGPLDPRPGSPTYGCIMPTPKPGWSNFDFVSAIRKELSLPLAFDTDVNGAALGEWRCPRTADPLDSAPGRLRRIPGRRGAHPGTAFRRRR